MRGIQRRVVAQYNARNPATGGGAIEMSSSASQADGVPTRYKADIHDQKPNVRFGSLADTQRPENFQMAELRLRMLP